MNNSAIKKFMGNKNTVTIISVFLILAILYIGYKYEIDKKVASVSVPVASVDIGPKTEITDSMVKTVSIPVGLIEGTEFWGQKGDVVGKYTNYNSTIVMGSLFYKSLLVKAEDLPDTMFDSLPDGYRVVSLPISELKGLYGSQNSYVDVYFSAINDNNKVMFGEFLSGIKIMNIVDENGQTVYGSAESGAPATMYIAVPEDYYILFNKFDRLDEVSTLGAYLVLSPHGVDPKDTENGEIDIYLTSSQVKDLIESYAVSFEQDEEPIKVTPDVSE